MLLFLSGQERRRMRIIDGAVGQMYVKTLVAISINQIKIKTHIYILYLWN